MADTSFIMNPMRAFLVIMLLIVARIALGVIRKRREMHQREELETAIKDWAKGIK